MIEEQTTKLVVKPEVKPEVKTEAKTESKRNLVYAEWFPTQTSYGGNIFSTTWSNVDRYGIPDIKEYRDILKMSRFFYRHDPIASTVINKLIDIAITDINFFKGTLSDNELRIFEGVKPAIRTFLEDCALEFLLTGMVIPEVKYATVSKSVLKSWGVKKMEAFTVPVDMWIRDSATIVINRSFISSMSTYYVEIPNDFIYFIKTGGTYPDGTVDKELYAQLVALYPAFVQAVLSGETKIKLENPFVIERRKLSDSQYPTPYTYGALESLKHKRNLRKMDYSIAARVITAIQLITLGSDEFPLTEDDSAELEKIRQQLYYRESPNVDMERVFQLFGNHTLKVSWVFPETSALLDEKKYLSINSDILMAFGFPKILVTGETDRTGTSQPEFAILSPLKTMESMRSKLLELVNKIANDIVELNQMSGKPIVRFEDINLNNFERFFDMLVQLYDQGNVSRDTLVSKLGLEIETELQKRKEEKDLVEKLGLDEVPVSNVPGSPQPKKTEPTKAEPAKKTNDGGK